MIAEKSGGAASVDTVELPPSIFAESASTLMKLIGGAKGGLETSGQKSKVWLGEGSGSVNKNKCSGGTLWS